MGLNLPDQWEGDNPFYLMIFEPPERVVVGGEIVGESMPKSHVIDLDQRGWIAANEELMRGRTQWYLIDKQTNGVVFGMQVYDGEQPYYTARHIGIGSASGLDRPAEVTAYGIGKKRNDGHVDRLWKLPNGLICTGDDVDTFGIESVKRGEF